MKSIFIEYEKLESQYFNQLTPDDCIKDAAAVMALDYHYRRDYNKKKAPYYCIYSNVLFSSLYECF